MELSEFSNILDHFAEIQEGLKKLHKEGFIDDEDLQTMDLNCEITKQLLRSLERDSVG